MDSKEFNITIEVVPPSGPDPSKLLKSIDELEKLNFHGFSVATNPVAKPNMDALSMCKILMDRYKKPANLHCTTRDHNKLSLQGLLWGAKALGIQKTVIMTGDMVAFKDRGHISRVNDLDVFDLVKMSREAGLKTGVVIEPVGDEDVMSELAKRLERKVEAGAQFVITQPVYDEKCANILKKTTAHLNIPVILGILPLRTFKHAEFLHKKVSGIYVPEHVRERIKNSSDSVKEGCKNAKEILDVARSLFSGACIMPPFEHFEVMEEILS